MDEKEFQRQVKAAPGLKSGCITHDCPQSFTFRCTPVSGSVADLHGRYDKETGRLLVASLEFDETGDGSTLGEAIRNLNLVLPWEKMIVHPATKEMICGETELDQIRAVSRIAAAMVDDQWRSYPEDSEEFKKGNKAAVLAKIFSGMVEASRTELLGLMESYPEYREALEHLTHAPSHAYFLLFGENPF